MLFLLFPCSTSVITLILIYIVSMSLTTASALFHAAIGTVRSGGVPTPRGTATALRHLPRVRRHVLRRGAGRRRRRDRHGAAEGVPDVGRRLPGVQRVPGGRQARVPAPVDVHAVHPAPTGGAVHPADTCTQGAPTTRRRLGRRRHGLLRGLAPRPGDPQRRRAEPDGDRDGEPVLGAPGRRHRLHGGRLAVDDGEPRDASGDPSEAAGGDTARRRRGR